MKPSSKPTKDHKEVFKTLSDTFGGDPCVVNHGDENEKSFIEIFSSVDVPQKGITSYGTIGLFQYPLIKDGKEFGTRVELVGACGSNFKHFDNILATAAFCVINSKWYCCPGAVFPDIVDMYKASKTLRHVLFVPPSSWDGSEKLNKTINLGEKKLTWLLAIPISEREYKFVEKEGSEKLERLFEKKHIDFFNLNRSSVV